MQQSDIRVDRNGVSYTVPDGHKNNDQSIWPTSKKASE
jgi:hypothetical protein